jgi:hypothetical protein
MTLYGCVCISLETLDTPVEKLDYTFSFLDQLFSLGPQILSEIGLG